MDSFGRTSCMTMLLVLLGLACIAASQGTDGKSLDSQSLIQLGRKIRKPILTLIGMVIRNQHECSQWTMWNSCNAERPGFFGSRERTRTCYHEMTAENDTVTSEGETEIDYEICEGTCPDTYNITSHGFCLKLHKTKKSYEDAIAQCEADGGALVQIDIPAKYTDVKNMTSQYSSRVFVAGKRPNLDSPWEEYVPAFVSWYSGEPSERVGELCIYQHENDRRWADIECSNSYGFVCEVQM